MKRLDRLLDWGSAAAARELRQPIGCQGARKITLVKDRLDLGMKHGCKCNAPLDAELVNALGSALSCKSLHLQTVLPAARKTMHQPGAVGQARKMERLVIERDAIQPQRIEPTAGLLVECD